MIFSYKVKVVVILVKPEEAPHKWTPYFSADKDIVFSRDFNITRTKKKDIDKYLISELAFHLDSKNNEGRHDVTVLHYQGWPDKSKFKYLKIFFYI